MAKHALCVENLVSGIMSVECKKRDINTPEVKNALDLLERYIYPKWLIPQFRHHVENQEQPHVHRQHLGAGDHTG